MRARVACLVACGALGACGPKDDVAVLRSDHCPVTGCQDSGPEEDAGPTTIPPEPLEPWDTTDAGPLSGIFAVEAVINARVGIEVETRQIFRLRIVQHGTTLKQKTNLCAFKLPDVEGVATLRIPPALQTLMQQKSVEAEGDFLSSTDLIGAAYAPPASLLVVGAKLADETKDPLPTAADPTNAIDEDQDGNPGVTLDAGVVTCGEGVFEKLFVALRTSVKLSGKVVTPDRIDGKADVTLDESVVGMSDDCLTSAAQIKILVQPGSTIKAVRVGDAEDLDHNGNVSCPELAIGAEKLFGSFWGG